MQDRLTQPPAKSIHTSLLAVLFALSILLGLQTATQMFAWKYHFSPSLGESFHHFYWPWKILTWYQDWHTQYQLALLTCGMAGLGVVAICLVSLLFLKSFVRNTAVGNDTIHGSAKWATRHDIEQAGLLEPKITFWQRLNGVKEKPQTGVYVGAWEDKDKTLYFLRHNGPEHVLTYAPTRSGKGVGLVIPTLLSWRESAVITDLKGELWALTAGYRSSFGKKVLKFEPASKNSAHWNPLDEVRFGSYHEVGDAQNLATLIVDPEGKGVESHWQKTSQELLTGLILFVLQRQQNGIGKASISEMDRLLSNPEKGQSLDYLYKEMKEETSHFLARQAAQAMQNKEKKEASSIISTLVSCLTLYRDPIVAENTGDSSFMIHDLMNHEAAVSLYIITQPTDKDRLKPLVRILLNSVIRILAAKMEFKDGRATTKYKHRLLMMIDEFPSLGKLDILQESLAFLAGYGIKCYLICQDINQLKSKESGYGPDESITSNCHIQNAFPPNRIETAEHLSKLTGLTTIVKEQITTSGSRGAVANSQVSKHFHEVQRPLLTADEVLRMNPPFKNGSGDIEKAGDMLISVAGFPAIYGEQPLYFKDKIFLKRAKMTAPIVSDVLCKPIQTTSTTN